MITKLLKIVRRWQPGAHVLPTAVIGVCWICDRTVRHADGDRENARGLPQHDACGAAATDAAVSPLFAQHAFFTAISRIRQAVPGMKPLLHEANESLRQDGGPIPTALAVAGLISALEERQDVSRADRAKLLLFLRGLRRDLLGLASSATRTENAPAPA